MSFAVQWTPSAEQDPAAIWLAAPDQPAVTAAANFIDHVLEYDPQDAGESRTGVSRILIELPLAVEYDVIMDDAKVVVWHVWRWQLPAG